MGHPYATRPEVMVAGAPYDAQQAPLDAYGRPMYVCGPPPAPRLPAARPHPVPGMTLTMPMHPEAWYSMSMGAPVPLPAWPSVPTAYAPYVPRWSGVASWPVWGPPAPVPTMPYAPPPVHYDPCVYGMHEPALPRAVPPAATHVLPDPTPQLEVSGMDHAPVAPEATAVPLARFCADTVWKASAEMVGLRRVSTRSGARLSPGREVRSESPEPHMDECVSMSSSSLSEPVTPPALVPALEDKELIEPMSALHLSSPHTGLSADLQRLVRAMGSLQQRPFPSLEQCAVLHAPEMPKRRARPGLKREHSALLGEVSPAFRHFTQQVLVQTRLSPTTLCLALHYVHMIQGMLWPGAGSADTEAALALLAQPPPTAPFKLLTLGLMMANKFLDDNTFLNKTWHEVTGIPLEELNRMEAFFLCRTQFHLSVSDSAWRQHLQAMRAEAYANTDDVPDVDEHVGKTLDRMLMDHVPGLCV